MQNGRDLLTTWPGSSELACPGQPDGRQLGGATESFLHGLTQGKAQHPPGCVGCSCWSCWPPPFPRSPGTGGQAGAFVSQHPTYYQEESL